MVSPGTKDGEWGQQSTGTWPPGLGSGPVHAKGLVWPLYHRNGCLILFGHFHFAFLSRGVKVELSVSGRTDVPRQGPPVSPMFPGEVTGRAEQDTQRKYLRMGFVTLWWPPSHSPLKEAGDTTKGGHVEINLVRESQRALDDGGEGSSQETILRAAAANSKLET